MPKEYTEIDTDTPKGRLLAFCHMVGLNSNREIEKLLDLGNGYFRSADKGMNTRTLCKIVRKYPTINLNWLICGCGNVHTLDHTQSSDSLSVAEPAPLFKTPSFRSDDKTPVQIFESPASFAHRDSSLPARWVLLERSFLHHNDDCLVKISDQSLSPTYLPEEYLHVSRIRNTMLSNLREKEKRLFLISICGEPIPLARLASRYNSQADVFTLSAVNPDRREFPDIVCSLSQIENLWEIANVLHL